MAKKITQGQLWKVTTDTFYTSGDKNKYKRPIRLRKGEVIEIRYPYDWFFRTEDNHYFHATTEMILENAELIGKILTQVQWENKANLEEILRLNLYEKL